MNAEPTTAPRYQVGDSVNVWNPHENDQWLARYDVGRGWMDVGVVKLARWYPERKSWVYDFKSGFCNVGEHLVRPAGYVNDAPNPELSAAFAELEALQVEREQIQRRIKSVEARIRLITPLDAALE